jgi:hypothetical protein
LKTNFASQNCFSNLKPAANSFARQSFGFEKFLRLKIEFSSL